MADQKFNGIIAEGIVLQTLNFIIIKNKFGGSLSFCRYYKPN